MPGKTTNNANETEKRNPCATIAVYPALFANQIDAPPYAKHSALTDKLDVKKEYFGIDTSAARAEEEKKFEEFNKSVDETQKKQISYILKQICVHANRPETDADKYLQEEKLTGKTFFEAVKELRIRVDNEGRKLNTEGHVLDESKLNPGAFKLGEKALVVDDKKIAQILLDSATEKVVGTVDEKFRAIAVENRESTVRMEKYKSELTDTILKDAGYTKEELDNAFGSCFYGYYPKEPNYDALKKRKMEFIKQKMESFAPGGSGVFGFDRRNEETFVAECEKLDVALRAYVFPKNEVKEVDEKRAFHNMTKDEYEKFALDNITPAGISKSMESKLNAYLDDCKSNKNKVNRYIACSYIKHLEDIHKKRPLMTRFFDYFRSNGEDSTIKRMKKNLAPHFSKADIKEVMEDEELEYDDGVTYEGKFQSSGNAKIEAWKDIEETADDKLEKIDEAEYGTRKLKEEIVNDRKEKEEPQEDIMDMLARIGKERAVTKTPAEKQNGELNK